MEQNGSLSWTKVSWFRREYVLSRGDERLARVVFGGWTARTARIEVRDGAWTIARTGLWKPRVSMEGPGRVVSATARWSGNYDLDTPLDGAFRWRCLSMWKMHYGWIAFDGAPLIRYRPSGALSYGRYVVDFLDRQPLTDSRLMLTVLGGYLLALTLEDIGASAVAAS